MKIVIKTSSGVHLMTLVDGASWDDVFPKWQASHPDIYISHRELPDKAIPQDRTFRNAWQDMGAENAIEVNMAKARNIQRDKLRELRKPMLERLDVDYMRADEGDDETKKAAIILQKNALRDVTKDPSIESAQTPDELKLTIPAILLGQRELKGVI